MSPQTFQPATQNQLAKEKTAKQQFVGAILGQFSNDCQKPQTKTITSTNHNRSRQHDEPITIPSNYL